MASSSSSSSSSKRGTSPGRQQPGAKQDKKWPSVDDYRYLAAGLLGQAPKMVKSKSHNVSNGDYLSNDRLEQNLTEKEVNFQKNNVEIKTMQNLAKEMGRMLAHAKTKGHTNELLQLFKSTLNNFVTDKHQMTSSSTEGSNFKSQSSSRKRITKSQPPQLKGPSTLQGHRKTAVVPKSHYSPALASTPSDAKHSKQSGKAASEFTVMSDRERSVITTTTVTRTKIREPMISVIESSKTNVLHRCYGKQSMKALPLAHKNKKSNNSTNIGHGPTPVKARTPMKVIKPQKSSTNQQMKTIYENEQFDKSNGFSKSAILVNKVSLSGSVQSNEQRPSAPTITNTNNKIVAQKKHTQIIEDSKIQQPKDCYSSDNLQTPSQETLNICKSLQPYNSEQDNSLVQRLTSFWNKKLNANEKNTSDMSSTTSSATYIINVNSDNSLVNKKSSSGKLSDENLSNSFDMENENVKTGTVQPCGGGDDLLDRIQGDPELPDIKVGLMDELIGVLKTKRNLPIMKKESENNTSIFVKVNKEKVVDKNKDEKSESLTKVLDLINSNDTFSNVSSDGFNGCMDEEIEDDYSTEETAVEDLDIENLDEDEDIVSPRYDDECDEETIEAIQTCLMRRITVRNFNKNKYDNDENEIHTSTSDESCKEYDGDCNSKDQNESKSKLENDINTECCDDYKHGQEEEDHIYSRKDETVHIAKTNKLKDFGVNCHMNSLTARNDTIAGENDCCKNNTIAATIMNVNDIIKNLRSLIFAIETIPEELKAMSVDLDSLPIPDKIKRTLSLMVDKDLCIGQKVDNLFENLQSTDYFNSTTGGLDGQPLSLMFTQGIYYDNFNDKTLGCCKREGSLFTCYIPSTFTIPIFENVMNPFHLILFPKRNDYLRSKLKPIACNIPQSLADGYDKFESGENKPLNGDNYTYVTRVMSKAHLPHFTVFYGTVAPNKLISAQSSQSRSFQPHSKAKVTQIQDVTAKFTKENELDTAKETYTVGLMCMNTDSCNSLDGWQKNSSVKIICENDNKSDTNGNNTNRTDGNCCQEGDLNFVDIGLNNDLNPSRCHNSDFGNCGRKRWFWRQTNCEEEAAAQSGGGGDYNLLITPVPCPRTSSMSVMLSSSVKDSNSLPNIHQIENERGYSSFMSRMQADMDFLSCGVIRETCEEHLSDIEDCVMVEQHQSQEIRKCETESDMSEDKSKQEDDKTCITNFDVNEDKHVLAIDNENNNSLLDQKTSTTDLKITETSSIQDISTMVNCTDVSLLQNFNNSGNKEDKKFPRDGRDSDYIVLCCKTTTSKRLQVSEQKVINKKYDLEVLLNNDPNLKQELSNVIDLDNLCDKERQLIAVCLMLQKRNTFVFENSLLRIILQSLEKGASSLWSKTSKRFSGNINKAKRRLIGKCQSQKQILISCDYRNLIKIFYTTLISLMLCFVIQKQFCGISLPILFPW